MHRLTVSSEDVSQHLIDRDVLDGNSKAPHHNAPHGEERHQTQFCFIIDLKDDNFSLTRLQHVQQTGEITAWSLNKWQLILPAKRQVLAKSRGTARSESSSLIS